MPTKVKTGGGKRAQEYSQRLASMRKQIQRLKKQVQNLKLAQKMKTPAKKFGGAGQQEQQEKQLPRQIYQALAKYPFNSDKYFDVLSDYDVTGKQQLKAGKQRASSRLNDATKMKIYSENKAELFRKLIKAYEKARSKPGAEIDKLQQQTAPYLQELESAKRTMGRTRKLQQGIVAQALHPRRVQQKLRALALQEKDFRNLDEVM